MPSSGRGNCKHHIVGILTVPDPEEGRVPYREDREEFLNTKDAAPEGNLLHPSN